MEVCKYNWGRNASTEIDDWWEETVSEENKCFYWKIPSVGRVSWATRIKKLTACSHRSTPGSKKYTRGGQHDL